MPIRIGDGTMQLDIDGRIVATATERAGGWWEVTYWPRFFDRNQAITALTVTGLLESGRAGTPRSWRRSGRSCLPGLLIRFTITFAVARVAEHGIEGLGPVHVGDRDDDYLEVGVHGPVIPGSGGNPNTASRPGFPNEVTWLIPRSVTVSTQTP